MQMNCKNKDFFFHIHSQLPKLGRKKGIEEGKSSIWAVKSPLPSEQKAEDRGMARSQQVLNGLRERDLGYGELQMFWG